MRVALDGSPELDFKKPSGLKRVTVCTETGQAATQYCPTKVSELVLSATKLESCDKHSVPAQIKIPNLVGMTKEAALSALDKLNLLAKVIEKDVAGVSAGTVASQTPAKGSVATSTTVVTITVSNGGAANESPVADFKMPTTAGPGDKVTLDGSDSHDDGKIVTWYWEFDDGTTASGHKTSHSWSSIGPHTVTLWVTDDHGQQATATKTISIK